MSISYSSKGLASSTFPHGGSGFLSMCTVCCRSYCDQHLRLEIQDTISACLFTFVGLYGQKQIARSTQLPEEVPRSLYLLAEWCREGDIPLPS